MILRSFGVIKENSPRETTQFYSRNPYQNFGWESLSKFHCLLCDLITQETLKELSNKSKKDKVFHKSARKVTTIDFYQKLKLESFKQSSKVYSTEKFFLRTRSIFLFYNAHVAYSKKSLEKLFVQETLKENG